MWNAVIDFLAWVLESLAKTVSRHSSNFYHSTRADLSIKVIRSARMSLMQPKIQEIQERYANDASPPG